MKILLICSAGTSTSLVVSKMIEESKKAGKDYEILAMSAGDARENASEYDVLMLGPQMGFALNTFKAQFSDKPITVIPPQYYGMLDGKAVLDLAEKMYNEK